MANIKRANTSGVTKSGVAIADVPDMPTIGTATGSGLSASITYTAATTGGTATTFTAISTPGSITATGSSPITVSGLSDGTSYTFRVYGTNSTGQGPASSASNSITATSTVPSSYDSLGTVFVPSGGLSSVIFSGIPVGYRHLQLRVMGKITGSVTEAATSLSINETAITRSHYFGGDGSSAFTNTGTSGYIASMPGASATSWGFIVIDVLDYSDIDKNKTIKAFNGWDNNGSGLVLMYSGLLTSTDAVKTIKLDPGSGNWAQYSHFALYGVK